MGYAVVREYNPVKRNYTEPKVYERLEAIKICLNKLAVMAPVADSKEEAIQKYWKTVIHLRHE